MLGFAAWLEQLTVREGYSLAFTMVGIIKPTPRPTAKKLAALTNEELQSQTTLMCATHGHTLQKEDVYKAYGMPTLRAVHAASRGARRCHAWEQHALACHQRACHQRACHQGLEGTS